MTMIGKSEVPRGSSKEFFDQNGIVYYKQAKAWMDKNIFFKTLEDWNRTLDKSKKSILLMDNFSGHQVDFDKFPNIIPVFLPPNTTSRTQPLDGGIIASFKCHYKSHLVRYSLEQRDAGTFNANNINVVLICPWINQAFKSVKNSTILKCFQRTVPLDKIIMAETVDDEVEDAFDEMKTLRNQMAIMLKRDVSIAEVGAYINHTGERVDDIEIIEEDDDAKDTAESDTIMIPDFKRVMKNFG